MDAKWGNGADPNGPPEALNSRKLIQVGLMSRGDPKKRLMDRARRGIERLCGM